MNRVIRFATCLHSLRTENQAVTKKETLIFLNLHEFANLKRWFTAVYTSTPPVSTSGKVIYITICIFLNIGKVFYIIFIFTFYYNILIIR